MQGSTVKLSQCMIVKNEEGNIEKALSWGHGLVHEQIVVDTGSTDRTVEIARGMGADVRHFDWVNDFGAAKNYAIEQAAGDWIAFLDADEYFSDEDAGKVLMFLEMIQNDEELREKYLAVFCPWIHLDDSGSPIGVSRQMRLFRNLPDIRYIGRVHEYLSVDWAYAVTTEDFRIMHTGYADSSYRATGKAKRNIEILRDEVQRRPDSMNYKAYLADSLLADAEKGTGGEEERAEAMRLYREVIDSDGFVLPDQKKNVYKAVLDEYTDAPDADPRLDDICEKAYREFPGDPLFLCYKAMSLCKNGGFGEAFDILKDCEAVIGDSAARGRTLTAGLLRLFNSQMIFAAQGLGDKKTVSKHAAILLMGDRANEGLLKPYIANLMGHCGSADEALERLAQIYDLRSKSDLIFIARAAKDCGQVDLARMVVDLAGMLEKR